MRIKKIFSFIFLMFLFIPLIVEAEVCDNDSIKLLSIDFEEKTEGVEESAEIVDNIIKLDAKLFEVNDYIKYKVVIKNDSDEDYKINGPISNSDNTISYQIVSEDNSNIIKKNETKEVYLIVTYTNKVGASSFQNGEYNSVEPVIIQFMRDEELINPKTSSDSLWFIMIIFLLGIILIYYKGAKKRKYFTTVLLFALAIPFICNALCTCDVNIDSNITIPEYKGRNLNNIIKDGASIDNQKSEFVESENGIDFLKSSSDTNGKGNYIFSGSIDDENPIYYYRGVVEDNYVLFANYCWRIIRTTETGGIKLVYHGVPTDGKCLSEGAETEIATGINYNASYNNTRSFGYNTSGGHVVKSKVNSNIANGTIFANDVTYENGEYILSDNRYVKDENYSTERDANLATHHYTCFKTTDTGCASVNFIFMTRDQGNYYVILSGGEKIEDLINNDIVNQANTNKSDVRNVIDEWYRNNMTGYSHYLEDTIWCNDRSIKDLGGWSKDGKLSDKLIFNANHRVAGSGEISLTCSNPNDRFTMLQENGNGTLDYPIGLLTLDEGALAGYAWYEESDTYLSNGQVWWTMSPSLQSAVYMYMGVIHSMTDNVHTAYRTGTAGGVRPAISLKNICKIEAGDGTKENPFTIMELN